MITKEKVQTIANAYNLKVVDVETLHDGNGIGVISDYIRMKVENKNTEYTVNVYLGNDYKIVDNKEYYVETKIKNALHSAS